MARLRNKAGTFPAFQRLFLKKIAFSALFLLAGAAAADNDAIARLVAAYPGFLQRAEEPNVVQWKDGARMPFDDGTPKADFEERFTRASLADQMSIPYPTGWPVAAPRPEQDPGRLRHEPFFRKMYGGTAKEVEQNLTSVAWKPAGGKKIRFSRVNGAAAALESVSAEADLLPPAARRYVTQPIGAFNWRPIAGSDRLSMHALGIAIDFQLPAGRQWYWQWDDPNPRHALPYPAHVLNDANLGLVVELFEKHGFIWGGKWAHYDTMHFEFRPELLKLRGP